MNWKYEGTIGEKLKPKLKERGVISVKDMGEFSLRGERVLDSRTKEFRSLFDILFESSLVDGTVSPNRCVNVSCWVARDAYFDPFPSLTVQEVTCSCGIFFCAS